MVAVAAVAVAGVVPPTNTIVETTAVAEMLSLSKHCQYKYRYFNLYTYLYKCTTVIYLRRKFQRRRGELSLRFQIFFSCPYHQLYSLYLY